MPRRGRQILGEQRVFFVTTATKNHQAVFDSIESRHRLKEIIWRAVKTHGAKLYGYVLMPDHFHLLLRIEGGGPQLSEFMRDIKSMSWRTLFSHRPGIWAARFDDVAIYTEVQFQTKLDYIHNNPVKAGLAVKPEDYQFSSAANWVSGKYDELVTTDLDE